VLPCDACLEMPLCENPLYHFKGARSAPGWPPCVREHRATDVLAERRRNSGPQLAGRQGKVARRASAAFLWPLRATSAPSRTRPRGRPDGQRAVTSAVVRWLQEGPSLRRLDPEALQDHGQGRSLRSRLSAPLRELRPARWCTGRPGDGRGVSA
jgi:hypothetical protein